MPSSQEPNGVPAHLRKYVVQQAYAEYTEVDHAVWRFVLMQAKAYLEHAAHPAYTQGLTKAGITIARIPRIDDMNEKLARFGWGAVCVDGFIPPRAFQDFQANRILPVAAEIRSPEHLAYTPAPDILHEAAGHAPFLTDPSYAAFIQTFGATAAKAFALPADRAVYEAIHALSELKEHALSTDAQLAAGNRALLTALASVTELSESARLARLYWWTAEYGVVGTPEDFKLYGAGLLSSLGESRSCRSDAVRKLPLSAACVDVDYDITRAQPQLFVARDFAQPLEILGALSATMAHRTGGAPALTTAQKSGELATLTLDTGLSVSGVVSHVQSHDDVPSLVQVSGAPVLSRAGQLLHELTCPSDYVIPLGRLCDGVALSALTPAALARYTHEGCLRLPLRSGLTITGTVHELHHNAGRMELVLLSRCEITASDGQSFRCQAPYPLLFAECVTSVCAGAPPGYFGSTEPSRARVPRPRWFTPSERELRGLYEQALAAWTNLGGDKLVPVFERLVEDLDRSHKGDWLLRWNLLESLLKVAREHPLADRLERDLEALEVYHQYQAPIATGLRYLRSQTEVR